MVVVPTVTSVSTPTEGSSTVATSILLLLQVPPDVAHVSVSVPVPIHAYVSPEIAEGVVRTVTTIVAGVPQPFAYVIVHVPFDTPETTPVVPPTVAIEVLLLDQLPTPPGFDSVISEPIHTEVGPVMAAGLPFTTNVTSEGQPDTL